MRRLRKPSAKGKSGEETTAATNLEALTSSSIDNTTNASSSSATETHAGVSTNLEQHNSPTKQTTCKSGGVNVGAQVVTPVKFRSRRSIMDTNGSGGGGSSSTAAATSPTTSSLGKEVFKHFEKSGKSELYGLFNSSCRPYFSIYKSILI